VNTLRNNDLAMTRSGQVFSLTLSVPTKNISLFKRELLFVGDTGSGYIWYRWKENHVSNQPAKFRVNIPRNNDLAVTRSGQ